MQNIKSDILNKETIYNSKAANDYNYHSVGEQDYTKSEWVSA